MDNQINCEKAKFWTDQGVLNCKIHNDSPKKKIQLETLQNYINAIARLCNNELMPFLIDTRDVRGTYVISVAKLLATSPELNKIRSAEIFVVNSVNMRLLVNSYKRIYNTTTPYEIFENYEQAKEYCLEIKKNSYATS